MRGTVSILILDIVIGKAAPSGIYMPQSGWSCCQRGSHSSLNSAFENTYAASPEPCRVITHTDCLQSLVAAATAHTSATDQMLKSTAGLLLYGVPNRGLSI